VIEVFVDVNYINEKKRRKKNEQYDCKWIKKCREEKKKQRLRSFVLTF